MLQIVPIDINAHKAADRATGGQRNQPVPLPSSADDVPAPVEGQVSTAVLAQVEP